MKKAIIFDMDGLMIDTEIVNYYAFRDFFKTKNVELSKQDYCTYITGRSIENAFIKIKEIYHIEFTMEEAFDYLKQSEPQRSQNIPLKEGLLELLHYLKENHYKIAMATSSGLERVYALFKNHQVLDDFDEIVCGTDVKRGKPAPDIFLKACEKLNVHTHEALVLEDSESGIEAAYHAKVDVICIPDMKEPDHQHQMMLKAQLSSLKDVIDYLKEDK